MASAATDKRALIDGLQGDLAREYKAIVQYVIYSQKLDWAQFQTIASEMEQLDYFGAYPTHMSEPVEVPEDNEGMLRTDLRAEDETIAHYRERIGQAEALGEYAPSAVLRGIVVQERDHQIELASALGVTPTRPGAGRDQHRRAAHHAAVRVPSRELGQGSLVGFVGGEVWATRRVIAPPPIRTDTRHRFPPEISGRAAWPYRCCTLGHRAVEALHAERGALPTYETVRRWWWKCGQAYTVERRRSRSGDTWQPDASVIRVNGATHRPWRSVRTGTGSLFRCGPAGKA